MIDFLRKKLFSDVVQLLLPFGYVTGTVLIYVFFFTVYSDLSSGVVQYICGQFRGLL